VPPRGVEGFGSTRCGRPDFPHRRGGRVDGWECYVEYVQAYQLRLVAGGDAGGPAASSGGGEQA
jgi:hypothetical protein